ncbi:hypothetical protein S40285_09903 [Stachybotrys chlorohalonatus IBT 40285]|uniref:Uncharacterized protein n=1 Tax=Stachybotrys chlorohalonatus (strain IBT 40285) TaxID=1283841 RepID=A0A084QLK3_STAC4|nr:hypothetical protein S40285_09903 [Stachybotrys chlorohalonata IBT 40285]
MLCQSIDLLAPIVTSVAAPRIIAQPALRLYFGFAFALCVALRSQSPLIAWTFSYSFRSHDEETTSPVNGAVRSRHAAACLSPPEAAAASAIHATSRNRVESQWPLRLRGVPETGSFKGAGSAALS